MKLIIDIDKELKSAVYNCGLFLNPAEKTSLINAINNGIPISDNVTNGDIIRTLFKPNHIERTDDNVIVENYDFNKEWWNSPYKR